MVRSLEGKNPKYYEAKLQLRECNKEVKQFVEAELDKYQIPVSDFKKVKNGYDYHIADNDFTRALGKKLQQHFGGQILITASLFSRKDGKEIYRTTVLFRQSQFKRGDIIEYQGEEYEVKAMNKDILLKHTKNGKKEHVNYKDMKDIKTKNI